MSRLCEEIDGRVKAFLERPIEGDWPNLWIDATYLKARRGGRIVSIAAIIAVGVNSDGRREVLGMEVGTSEAEPIWTAFLRKLTRRGFPNLGQRFMIQEATVDCICHPNQIRSTPMDVNAIDSSAACLRTVCPTLSKVPFSTREVGMETVSAPSTRSPE